MSKMGMLVIAFIAYELFFKSKGPALNLTDNLVQPYPVSGDVQIGDATIGSSPGQWKMPDGSTWKP